MSRERHPDFQRFFDDFVKIRGPLNGPVYYAKFLDAYQLDDSLSYAVTNRARLMEFALKSAKHQAIKRQFPKINFDQYLTGVRRAVGRALKLRLKHPTKLRLKNIRGRRVNVRLGEGVPVVVEPVSQPMKIRLSNPAKLRVRNFGERKLQIKFGGGDN